MRMPVRSNHSALFTIYLPLSDPLSQSALVGVHVDGYRFIEPSEDGMREILSMCGCDHDQTRLCAAFTLFMFSVCNAEKRCRLRISTANLRARAPRNFFRVLPLSQLQRPVGLCISLDCVVHSDNS